MLGLERQEFLYVACAFIFQIVLIIHFALRKWRYEIAMHYGPIVYALSIPAGAISILHLVEGEVWSLWIGGFIYLVWAVYGYLVEYVRKVRWRNPIRWRYFGPYVFLYLTTIMFYWWPLALVSRSLWYVYAFLFVISTTLNIISHQGSQDRSV